MTRKYRNRRSNQRWHWCYALVLGALSSRPIMSGMGLLPCLGRHFPRPENDAELPPQCESRHSLVCDQRTVSCEAGVPVSGVCRDWGHTPIRSGHGGCASTLESASPLLSSSESSWIAGKRTKLALNPEEPVTEAACPWGGRARGGQSAPVCPCLGYLSRLTSELTFRSVGQFRLKRQGQRRVGDGTVALYVQYKLPGCWR